MVDPNSGLAFTVEVGTCAIGMSLKSATDDHTSNRQRFYLGQHGSIFSAQCPGLVIAAAEDSTVKLDIFHINKKKLKWKFSHGMIESVSSPGKVLADKLVPTKVKSGLCEQHTGCRQPEDWEECIAHMDGLGFRNEPSCSTAFVAGTNPQWKPGCWQGTDKCLVYNTPPHTATRKAYSTGNPGLCLCTHDTPIVLQDTNTSTTGSSLKWIRMNTRLLESSTGQVVTATKDHLLSNKQTNNET